MEVTSLVVNVVHVKRVRGAEEALSCSVGLRSLCSSSALGQRVYGQALALLCQREYLNDLDQIINDELCDEITMEKFNLADCKAQTSADKWGYDLRCKSKSTVTADYLGVDIVLNIIDATSVAHGKICCRIKWLGVKRGKVIALWFAKEIFDLQEEKVVPDICQSILSPMTNDKQGGGGIVTGHRRFEFADVHGKTRGS